MEATRIVLIGAQRSGKTTLARNWAEEHSGIVLSFATRIRETLAQAMFDIQSSAQSLSEMLDTERKEQWRPLMQAWGKRYRDIDRKHWVVQVEKTIIASKDIPLVVDDCRYPNEYDMLMRHRFIPFGCLDASERWQLPLQTHESEMDWPLFVVKKTLLWTPDPLDRVAVLDEYIAEAVAA